MVSSFKKNIKVLSPIFMRATKNSARSDPPKNIDKPTEKNIHELTDVFQQ